MSHIVACYKWVLDEADIVIKDDLSVDVTRAQGKISDFDRSAIEAAMQAASETGDEVVALTYGPESVTESFKDALSRGPEKAFWITNGTASDADGRATANALAFAVEQIGDVSLVVCAEGASDTYARQVGPRLGAVLDWPTLTSVLSFKVGQGEITAVRKLEGSLQTVRASLPAVVSVLPEEFEPKAPGLKAIMAAKKKPSEQIEASALGAKAEPLAKRASLKGYESKRKRVLFDGDPEESVAGLVEALRKEGVL